MGAATSSERQTGGEETLYLKCYGATYQHTAGPVCFLAGSYIELGLLEVFQS